MNYAVWIIVPTLLSICGLSLSDESKESFPRVVTHLGTIEGYHKTSYNGRRYEAYEGIPYAAPPIGESRFRVARSVSPWEGVLIAKQLGPRCMQYTYKPCNAAEKVEGSEDCLYLNIYTPVVDAEYRQANRTWNHLRPVIFYVHGGAFQLGGAVNYDSKYLLDRNVTLVTFHYRLGPLGFLSTEDETVSGNMGLKDQVIALRWVKENIKYFGGDPSRITIFGQSAGGASVHYLYLTNLTAGLFQGGMSLSGTALNCWSQTENPLEKAKTLAKIVGCPNNNVTHMVDCLRARPAHQIVLALGEFHGRLGASAVTFGPVVEKGGGKFTFIDRPPVDIITSGHAHDVPWITGVVSEEGLVQVSLVITKEKLIKELNDDWETVAGKLLDFNDIVPKTDRARVARLIKQHYLGTSPFSRSTCNQTVQLFSDRLFGYNADEAARLQAQANRSPVRFYYFAYRGAHSFSDLLSGTNENFGVTHTDDEGYLFHSVLDPTTTPQDREMQKWLINMWVSFATNGTPDVGVEWPALSRSSTEELNYLHIGGPDNISMKTSWNFAQKNFWHSIGFHENNDGR